MSQYNSSNSNNNNNITNSSSNQKRRSNPDTLFPTGSSNGSSGSSTPSNGIGSNNNTQYGVGQDHSITWHAGMDLTKQHNGSSDFTQANSLTPSDTRSLLKALNARLKSSNTLPVEFRTMSIQVQDTIQANNSKLLLQQLQKAKKELNNNNEQPITNIEINTGSPPATSPSSLKDVKPAVMQSSLPTGSATSTNDTNYFASLDTHKLSIQDATAKFGTDIEFGLSSTDATKRLSQYGPNQLSTIRPNYLKKIATYLFGGFCSVLWIGVLVFFLCWQPLSNPPSMINFALAILVLIVILIQAIFSAGQDWSTSRVMKSILNMLPSECFVVRDGQIKKILTSQVVVGDIVHLNLGNKIPADMMIVQTSGDLKVDKSVLTGECIPITCTTQFTDENFLESKNIVFMGTHVVNGNGLGVVVLTGNNTVMGRINRLTSMSSEKVPLIQKEINRFVRIIVGLTILLAGLFALEWGVFLKVKHPEFQTTVAMLMNVMSCVVAFIPEGMPICVALTLLMVANRMKENNILPKALTTVETLGCVNVICSDKTGTLTQNKMTVTTVGFVDSSLSPGQIKDSLSTPAEDETPITNNNPSNIVYQQIQLSSILCNNSTWGDNIQQGDETLTRLINGDATDSAIYRFGYSLFVDATTSIDTKQSMLNETFTRLHDLPFNSKNKFMMTVYRLNNSNQGVGKVFGLENPAIENLMIVKGAPDVLLPRCTHVVLSTSNQTVPLSKDYLDRIIGTQEKWSRNGQRVILVTKRIVCPSKSNNVSSETFREEMEDACTKDLVVIGLLGLMAPKPEIYNTVATCRRSGSRFFMVTGDFGLTASSIARQIGIFTSEGGMVEPHGYDDLLLLMDENMKLFKSKQHGNDSQSTDESSNNLIGKLLNLIKYKSSTTKDNNHAMELKSIKSDKVLSLLLTGQDLEKIQVDKNIWDQINQYDEIVFARTTPEQKLRIVKEFQRLGNIVAVTGDGVNDAPALKAADVGVAVVSGSDVAIEAADLVLLGSFESITEAIRLGRLVFQNLQKVISYLLPAGSWSEIMPVIVNAFFGTPCPLSSFLMIIICCFTDLFPCLALIMEHEEIDLMSLPPRNSKKDHLITGRIYLQSYIFMGTMLTAISQGLFFSYIKEYTGLGFSDLVFTYGDIDYSKAKVSEDEFNNFYVPTGTCVTFIALVILQWGNILSIRNRRETIIRADPIRKQRRNVWIFVGMLFSLFIALIVTKVEWFHTVFLTGDVPIKYWLLPFPFALLILLIDEFRKLIVRNFPNGPIAYLAW